MTREQIRAILSSFPFGPLYVDMVDGMSDGLLRELGELHLLALQEPETIAAQAEITRVYLMALEAPAES